MAKRRKASGTAPLAPMEALLVKDLPEQPGWFYEPKWDGFRAIVARDNDDVEIWSKSGKPLARYFPEIVQQILELSQTSLLLDGELVIPIGPSHSFAALQARLHPAATRIAKLSQETPAQLILFDCLTVGSADLTARPLTERRAALERLHASLNNPNLILSPVSTDPELARQWLASSGGALDGVIAKPSDEAYRPGERAMRKVKQLRTADCVVGGYRPDNSDGIASLLLGLYDQEGKLDLVGFSSAFPAKEKRTLLTDMRKFEGGPGFTGRAPGGPSRWSPGKSGDYVPLQHRVVAEVVYDQVTARRFRHGTRLLRFRPDKAPQQCTADQLLRELRPAELLQLVDRG